MADETQQAESSPATETSTPETQATNVNTPLESLTGAQYAEWRKTGDIPDQSKAEESTPSTAKAKAEPEKAETEPAPAPGQDTQQEQGRQIPPAERRIKQLLSEKKELEARLAQATQPAQPRQPQGPAQRPVRPKIDAFEDYDKYEEALDKYEEDLADYKAVTRIEAERQAYVAHQRNQAIAEQNAKLQTAWEKQEAETLKRHPDFREVVQAGVVPLNPIMDGFILGSSISAEIVYELARNPDEAARIAALGPHDTARALRDIEIRLETAIKTPETPATPKTTAAKPPGTTLGGTNRGPVDEVEAALARGDFIAYKRLQNEREMKSSGRR